MIWMPQAAGPGGWTLEDLQATWEGLYEVEQGRDLFRARRRDEGTGPGKWLPAASAAELAGLIAADDKARIVHQRPGS